MQVVDPIPKTEKIMKSLGGSAFCCKEDEALTILYANGFFYQILGYKPGELTSFYSEAVWKNSGFTRGALTQELNRIGYFRTGIRLQKKDGRPVWVNCLMQRAQGSDGAQMLCGVMFDLTGRRMESLISPDKGSVENRLRESEQRYRMLIEESTDPIFDYDLRNSEIYCSPSFYNKLDLRVAVGGYLRQLRSTDFVLEEDRQRAIEDAELALRGGGKKHGEYRLKTKDGIYRWFRVRNTILFQPDGRPARIILFFTDIDQSKKETLLLKERAERDLLTGLYNHVTTTGLIDEALSKSGSGAVHALFLVDIDNFKKINDQMGHLMGDEAVEELGFRLGQHFREEDIVGRIGGDEFVVFLQNIPSEKILYQKARILNELFRSTQTSGEKTFTITCSVGVSLFPRDGRNFHELFQKADAAMYAAKRSGKDHFCIYSGEMENFGG